MGPQLIVGLGNPGREYAAHRHNIGFRVVDALAWAHGLTFSRQKSHARIAEGTICGCPVLLAKPLTYMNLSGKAVSPLLRGCYAAPEQLLVVYDDLDLPLGRLRLRPEGGSGGHKGMRSVIGALGTQAFPRLRVGIDRPPGQMDPADYVLHRFRAEDAPLVQLAVEQAVAAIECWLEAGIAVAMEQYNRAADGTAGNGQEAVD